jgi:aspartate ammonia-lyase
LDRKSEYHVSNLQPSGVLEPVNVVNEYEVESIPISLEPRMIQALGYVKKAAAMENVELEVLPKDLGRAIIAACDVVIAGELNDQFVVDVIQGEAGTSTNMNAN